MEAHSRSQLQAADFVTQHSSTVPGPKIPTNEGGVRASSDSPIIGGGTELSPAPVEREQEGEPGHYPVPYETRPLPLAH